MFDTENKLSLFKLINVFILATLASVALTSFVSGILLSMNSYFGADITDVLPVNSPKEHILSWWSSFILNPDGFNLFVIIMISVVLFAISLALIFLVFKDYKVGSVKFGIVLLIIFAAPSLLSVMLQMEFLDGALLYYIDDYNSLFHVIFMVMVFPSWIILGASYILLNQSSLLWKVLICVIYCLPIYYFDFDFYNSLYISTEKLDIKKEIVHVDAIDLTPLQNFRKYILVEPSGNVLIEKQTLDYKKIPLSKHNLVVLNNYIMNNAESALLEPITDFIELYYFENFDPQAFRDYLVRLYKKNPSPYVSAKLVSFLKSYSDPGNAPEEIESENPSKIGLGFLADLYRRSGQNEKAEELWKKYNSSKEKNYINTYIESWIYDKSKKTDNSVEVKGTLVINGSENAEIKLMLVAKNKDGLYEKMLDVTEADKDGNFSLTLNDCKPFALMVDLPSNIKVEKPDNVSKISLDGCKAPIDLGKIDFKSSN